MDHTEMIRYPLKWSIYNHLVKSSTGYMLYNALYDHVFDISNSQYSHLSGLSKREINADDYQNNSIVQCLFKSGFITNIDVDEYKLFLHSIARNRYRETSFINAIVIYGCNMNCRYCFEKWYGCNELESYSHLSSSFFTPYLKYLEKVFSSRENIREFKLAWFGGEPLLAWDSIKKYIPILRNMMNSRNVKFVNYMVTNGTKLDLLESSDYTLLDFMQITLDGSRKIHDSNRQLKNGSGTYDIIIERIRDIPVAFPIVIRINVFTSDLEDYIPVLYALRYRASSTTIDVSPILTCNICNHRPNTRFDGLTGREYTKLETALIESATSMGFSISRTLFPSSSNSSCWRILPHAQHITQDRKVYNCVTHLGDSEDYYGYIDSEGNLVFSNMNRYLLDKYEMDSKKESCKSCSFAPICAFSCSNNQECTVLKEPGLLAQRLEMLHRLTKTGLIN